MAHGLSGVAHKAQNCVNGKHHFYDLKCPFIVDLQ